MLSWVKEKGEQGGLGSTWGKPASHREPKRAGHRDTRVANKFLLGDRGQGDAVEAR